MNSPQRSVQVRPVSRVAIHVALTRLASTLGDVFGTSAEDYTSVRDTSGTEHRHLKRRCSLPVLLVTAHVLTTSEYQTRTLKNLPENRLAVEQLAGKSHVVYELDIGVSGHRIDWNPGLANVGVFRKRQFEYTIDE